MSKKSGVLSAQAFFGKTGVMPKGNNGGSVHFADILVIGGVRLINELRSKTGSGYGLLKVTQLDNWLTRVDIVRGNFIR